MDFGIVNFYFEIVRLGGYKIFFRGFLVFSEVCSLGTELFWLCRSLFFFRFGYVKMASSLFSFDSECIRLLFSIGFFCLSFGREIRSLVLEV